MKAVRYHSYGDSSVLVHEEAERPTPAAGQVVLQVAGTAFNPLDVAIRAGYVQQDFPVTFPHIPNFDVAGVITDIGDGVTGWTTGDTVITALPPNAPGAAAEYAVADASTLAAAPRTADLADAAALPSAGLTAWQSLFTHAQLKEGQTILVNGAGGAVGGYAVQLATQAGATVTATASPRSAERLRTYGADRIIDYTAAPCHQTAGQQYDVVLNLVRTSPQETAELTELVTDGGALVSTTFPSPQNPGRGIRLVSVYLRTDAAQLATQVARVDAGQLNIHVAARRPLTDLPAVHDEAVTGKLPGKTILIP